MKVFLGLVLLVGINVASGAVQCTGKISNIYKWDSFERLSIIIEIEGQGKTNWISMPTKSDESLALMAFASGHSASVYMSEDSVTTCIDGWGHNKVLKGYFIVSK
jgi:hypothetical protein